MKNLFIKLSLTLLLATFYACISNQRTENLPEDNLTAGNRLANQLDGAWLSENYISKIEKSKSIYANMNTDDSMLGFWLYKDTLTGKHPRLLGFSIHEGGLDAPLKYNIDKNRFENDLDLVNEFSAHKTPFFIKPVNPNKIEIQHSKPAKIETYRKVADIDSELRKVLFNGVYIDKLTNKTITFKEDGETTGIANKHFYSLLFDFEEFHFDVVFIADTSKRDNLQEYHYKIEGNNLRLYNLNISEETGYTIGSLAYDLVKEQ